MSLLVGDVPAALTDRVIGANAVINEAIGAYRPSSVFALFSGGHDSLTTTDLVSRHEAFAGAIHINTGIGIPDTTQFVRQTCAARGWPLHELRPSSVTGDYLNLIVRHGFPGPAQHTMMYRYLKERPLERFLAGRKRPVMLCAGARSQESVRRMGTVQPIRLDPRRGLWVNPIHDWSASETTQYIAWRDLRRNPVKDRLHISGECLCGCFADPNERREIAMWYPQVHERLSAYERIVRTVRAADLPETSISERHCEWGWGRGVSMAQIDLFPMCHYCHAGREGTA